MVASVSIIIPVYNSEEYLEECINSLLNQQFDDFEIILIDDGSTDKSPDIGKRYAKKYSEIFCLVQEQNCGQSVARNIGLDQASKDYIYFLDSDDKIAPYRLKKILKLAEKKDLEAVFFDGINYSSDSKLINQKDRSGRPLKDQLNRKKDYGHYESAQALLYYLWMDNRFIYSPCLYIVKRSVYENNHLRFQEGYINEDNLFTISVYLLVKTCCHVNDFVLLRRLRAGSTMTTQSAEQSYKHYLSYYNNFLSLEYYYDQYQLVNHDVYRILESFQKVEFEQFVKFSKQVTDKHKKDKFNQIDKVRKNHQTMP